MQRTDSIVTTTTFDGNISVAAGDLFVSISKSELEQLRALRLWHWKRHILHCKIDFSENAEQHLKFVRLLDPFFYKDDTAEKDAAK